MNFVENENRGDCKLRSRLSRLENYRLTREHDDARPETRMSVLYNYSVRKLRFETMSEENS